MTPRADLQYLKMTARFNLINKEFKGYFVSDETLRGDHLKTTIPHHQENS